MEIRPVEEKHLEKERVNGFIREAFGWGFRGDRDLATDDGSLFEHGARSESKLDQIARYVNLGLGAGFQRDAGNFTSQDGTEMQVREKYLPQAKKYAELYEAATGKEVTISLLPDFRKTSLAEKFASAFR